jgi:hypothetical protein
VNVLADLVQRLNDLYHAERDSLHHVPAVVGNEFLARDALAELVLRVAN